MFPIFVFIFHLCDFLFCLKKKTMAIYYFNFLVKEISFILLKISLLDFLNKNLFFFYCLTKSLGHWSSISIILIYITTLIFKLSNILYSFNILFNMYLYSHYITNILHVSGHIFYCFLSQNVN